MSNTDDLEAQGLVAHSYDSLFTIRKRLRKINDIAIPTRGGLGTDQIGVAVLVFVVQVVLYGLIIVPIFTLTGIHKNLPFLLIWLFGPAVLAAQQITKPLKYGKSIPGTLNSFLRYHLDDRVHRRGLPVRDTKAKPDMLVPHYEREWIGDDTYAAIMTGEQDVTDPITERRMAGQTVDLSPWLDTHMDANLAIQAAANAKRAATTERDLHYRRGTGATVVLGDDDEKAA